MQKQNKGTKGCKGQRYGFSWGHWYVQERRRDRSLTHEQPSQRGLPNPEECSWIWRRPPLLGSARILYRYSWIWEETNDHEKSLSREQKHLQRPLTCRWKWCSTQRDVWHGWLTQQSEQQSSEVWTLRRDTVPTAKEISVDIEVI